MCYSYNVRKYLRSRKTIRSIFARQDGTLPIVSVVLLSALLSATATVEYDARCRNQYPAQERIQFETEWSLSHQTVQLRLCADDPGSHDCLLGTPVDCSKNSSAAICSYCALEPYQAVCSAIAGYCIRNPHAEGCTAQNRTEFVSHKGRGEGSRKGDFWKGTGPVTPAMYWLVQRNEKRKLSYL